MYTFFLSKKETSLTLFSVEYFLVEIFFLTKNEIICIYCFFATFSIYTFSEKMHYISFSFSETLRAVYSLHSGEK